MQFQAKFCLLQQPYLWGCSKQFQFESDDASSCHELVATDVKLNTSFIKYSSQSCPVSEVPSDVTYVAGRYTKSFLYGPASTSNDKTIIYPCDKNRCRVGCPCQLCRKKVSHCSKAVSLETCGDCSDCRKDCDDHLLHHKAHHTFCKFCANVEIYIPHSSFVSLRRERALNDFYHVIVKSSIFCHVYKDVEQTAAQSSGLSCDNCGLDFKMKQDLKRHEISVHFEAKHECFKCGTQFTRFDNLLTHARIVHDGKDTGKYTCEHCKESFPKKSNLQRHCKVKKDCILCSEVFCSLRQLQKHKKSNHPVYAENMFKCNQCQKTFSTKWNHSVHVAKRDEKLCSECGVIFCSEYDLQVHCNTHKYVKCPRCDNSYLKASVDDHILLSHPHVPIKK